MSAWAYHGTQADLASIRAGGLRSAAWECEEIDFWLGEGPWELIFFDDTERTAAEYGELLLRFDPDALLPLEWEQAGDRGLVLLSKEEFAIDPSMLQVKCGNDWIPLNGAKIIESA